MTPHSIARQRLSAQHLVSPSMQTPEGVVAWLGGVQAQEYGPARWALGQRVSGAAVDADVAAAFDAGRIVRTHVLRPTWHFVAPEDLRWMLRLTGPRIRGSMAAYDRRLEIDARLVRRALRVMERSLSARPHQTRAELALALEAAGIVATGSRLAHLVLHAELEALVCSGPRRERQFTYALVDARVAPVPDLGEDEAFEALVVRYFRGHGPATLRDFTWWCGLRMTQARRILESLRASTREVDGLRYWWIDSEAMASTSAPGEPVVRLLPVYDEYTVAYRDRVAVPHGAPSAMGGTSKALVFHHALVIEGQIAGTWRVSPAREGLRVEVQPRRRLSPAERRGLSREAARYGHFMDAQVSVRLL